MQITRPLEVDLDDDGLSEFLDGLSFDGPAVQVRDVGGEREMGMEVEDEDEVCFFPK